MMEVKSRQNTSPIYFLEPIRSAIEDMRVDAIIERCGVIHDDVNRATSEKILHKTRRHSGNTPVRCWVLGVIGSGRQGYPTQVRHEFEICPACKNGRNGAPEVVGELCIPAGNAYVRVSRPEYCQ